LGLNRRNAGIYDNSSDAGKAVAATGATDWCLVGRFHGKKMREAPFSQILFKPKTCCSNNGDHGTCYITNRIKNSTVEYNLAVI
jgi:hypothetical protein